MNSLAQMQNAPYAFDNIPGMGGMAHPRVCEMGANTGDVGFGGCEP
jgi:hypothetical protein